MTNQAAEGLWTREMPPIGTPVWLRIDGLELPSRVKAIDEDSNVEFGPPIPGPEELMAVRATARWKNGIKLTKLSLLRANVRR